MAPLTELAVAEVFAFARPWARIARDLGPPLERHLGAGGEPWGSDVATRAVLFYRLPSDQHLVVSSQAGYAGPPGAADVERLCTALRAW